MSQTNSTRRETIAHTLSGPIDVARPLLEQLGIHENYLPDELAPPIDRERLARYLRGELPQNELQAVCRLIAAFRCWHEACTDLLRSGLKK